MAAKPRTKRCQMEKGVGEVKIFAMSAHECRGRLNDMDKHIERLGMAVAAGDYPAYCAAMTAAGEFDLREPVTDGDGPNLLHLAASGGELLHVDKGEGQRYFPGIVESLLAMDSSLISTIAAGALAVLLLVGPALAGEPDQVEPTVAQKADAYLSELKRERRANLEKWRRAVTLPAAKPIPDRRVERARQLQQQRREKEEKGIPENSALMAMKKFDNMPECRVWILEHSGKRAAEVFFYKPHYVSGELENGAFFWCQLKQTKTGGDVFEGLYEKKPRFGFP